MKYCYFFGNKNKLIIWVNPRRGGWKGSRPHTSMYDTSLDSEQQAEHFDTPLDPLRHPLRYFHQTPLQILTSRVFPSGFNKNFIFSAEAR